MTRSAACDNPPTREQVEIQIRLRFRDFRPRDFNDVIIANTLFCFVLVFAFGPCFARPTTRSCDILEETSSVERSILASHAKGLFKLQQPVTARADCRLQFSGAFRFQRGVKVSRRLCPRVSFWTCRRRSSSLTFGVADNMDSLGGRARFFVRWEGV